MTTSGISCSYVVTSGGCGVGRAVVERLIRDGGFVVAIELGSTSLGWLVEHPTAVAVVGDASDEKVATEAADRAGALAPLGGGVDDAALSRDASLYTSSAREVIDLVTADLAPAVVGCAVAVRRLLAEGTGGAIVNVSSHQAGRAVPGCTPYVTAKPAIDGLTRAAPVEYGVHGVRVNAVALASITTEPYAALLHELGPAAAARVAEAMRLLHPGSPDGKPDEVAATIAHLLSDEASFITGATVPVDGRRSVLARDPEAHEVRAVTTPAGCCCSLGIDCPGRRPP